jgi:hypothetical protein
MEYITIKRARFHSLSGNVNIPYGTKIDCNNNLLSVDGKPLCGDHSQNAYDFFSRNDDGNGLIRGKLVQAIKAKLAKRDTYYQARWDKVWADLVCQKYKREDHTDYWLWSHDFYNANIHDLQHIANIIGLKI